MPSVLACTKRHITYSYYSIEHALRLWLYNITSGLFELHPQRIQIVEKMEFRQSAVRFRSMPQIVVALEPLILGMRSKRP